MKTLSVLISSILLALNLWGQGDSSQAFIYFGPTDIGIGTVQGIHPNLDNVGFGNYINGDLRQSFRIKGIPLQFVGHVSNETLRIGKPSYFRLSYDEHTFNKLDKLNLQNDIDLKKLNLQCEMKALHELEGKLSYQREMLRRLELQDIPDLSNIDLSALPDSLNGLNVPDLDLNLLNLPNGNNNQKLDAISLNIQEMTGKMKDIKGSIDSLQFDLGELEKKNLSTYVPEKFRLKKANFGLTSLSSGGLSNNTIPIHGLHVEGSYKRSFYDVSAGLTQPFQNFSAQVFDQITGNTQNVFNLNDFYNVNRMKFISSEIVGLGEKNRTHLKMEHYYSGRTWEAIKDRTSEAIANTVNLSGNAEIKWIEKLNIGFLIGLSVKSKDTVNQSFGAESLAYRGTANYKIERAKGEIQSEFRSLGGDYDGVSQGLVINGTRHAMIGYQQKLGRHSNVTTRFMEDRFSKTDSIVLFNQSRRWMTQLNSRINRYNKFQLSYSLIQGSGNEVQDRKGHLGTVMFINEIKIGKNMLTNIVRGGYTFIPIRIGNQEITQGSISSDFHVDNFTYGLTGSYEKYIGIQQLWGENYILEPHVAYRGKKGEISFSYQYLKSQQFSEDHGFTFRANLSPSQFITWQVTGQRWLVKERNFFFIQAPSYVAPWYVDIKLIIHLNVQK